jgi:hypothetical protein
MMSKVNYLLADKRTRTALKVAGALLALMGLVMGGAAGDPIIFPG